MISFPPADIFNINKNNYFDGCLKCDECVEIFGFLLLYVQ